MALQFRKQEITCLQNVLSQVQNLEQTQELRIPEGMPGVGQIPGCWGQVLIRSKEWNGDTVRLTGGVQIWLLYVPEDGSSMQTLESWIPFQTVFDLPEDAREGRIRVKSLLRFADARPVSAGKVLIRAGIGLQIQCWSPAALEEFHPEGTEDALEVRTEHWPVELAREAEEKPFELDEELILPDSLAKPERLAYYRMTAEITDKKVLGNKLVFRGSAWMHLLYRNAEGQLCTWDFELPISQYVQLAGSYSPDARGDVLVEVTSLELTLDPEGTLRLHAGMTAQYLVGDRHLLETAADLYSPVQDVKFQYTNVELPALLEERRETARAEKKIPLENQMVVDTMFLPDFPRRHQEGDALNLECPGMIQILSQGPDGQIQGSNQRWEGNLTLKADGKNRLCVIPMNPGLQVREETEGICVHAELPLQLQFSGETGITMVTEVEMGQKKTLPENRPSLVLRRAGEKTLWDLARENGSTVSLIQAANQLAGEPEPEKMLLIPVV